MRERTLCNPNLQEAAFQAFSSSAFLTINKTLLQHYGPTTALILSNLIDKRLYFKNKFPDNDGWFFLTHEDQCKQLGVTEYTIRKVKKDLQKNKVLKTEMRGIPAKEWYFIDILSLTKILSIDLTNSVGLSPINSEGLFKDNIIKDNTIKNIYIPVLNKWNAHKIIIHKKITPRIESSIKQSLTYYSQEEIFKAIENYATVVMSKNHFFSYKWTLRDFLKRGLDKFVDEADPLNNFKNNGSPQTTKLLGRARSDGRPYPVDHVIT